VAGRLDRWAASDPGLNRLTSAARAVVAVGGALGIEYLVATLVGLPAMVPMLVGAVLAMMASFGVADPTRGGKAVTLLILPLFLFAGMGVALAVEHQRVLSLVVFVLVMFVAVAIRRFGPRYFNGGMVAFMGYFFALFLMLTPAQLPEIALAVAVATVWSMLLSLVLWPVDNAKVLRRMVRAFEGRVRGVAAAAAEVFGGATDPALLESRLVQVTESALIIDGQLGTPGAVVDDATAGAVRSTLIDDELAARALADCVRLLAAVPLPGDLRAAVVGLLDALRAGSWAEVEACATALDERAGAYDEPLAVAVPRPSGSAGHAPPTLAQVVRRLAAAAQGLVQGHRDRRDIRPSDSYAESGFVPAVQLFGGAMPGSQGTIAEMLAESTGPWWTRLSLTTRQAVQVAIATGLAVAAGDALSGQRYYWAVLAAFIAFTGTATAAQTVSKAVNRVLGTMIGLLAAIPLVAVTGNGFAVVLPLVLLSIFGAFYLMRVSYALMTFFITLLLGELYALLGTFTPELMLLRLVETAVGGAIGIAVALLVLPIRTQAVTVAARRAVLGSLRTLLDDLARVLRGDADDVDLQASARALDARLHQLLLLGATLLRPAPFLRNTERGRRLMIYTSLSHHARGLARRAEVGALPGRDVLAHVVERMVDLVDDLCADEPHADAARSAATSELLAGVDVREPRVRRFVHELGHLHDALVSLSDTPGVVVSDATPVPALHGRVRTPEGEPVRAVLTLTDTAGVQLDRVATDAGGRYRLQAAHPGIHLLVSSPEQGAPTAGWVRVGERAGVHDVVVAVLDAETRDGGAQPPANGGSTSTTAPSGRGRAWSRTATSSTR
jgi:hypothetical protein